MSGLLVLGDRTGALGMSDWLSHFLGLELVLCYIGYYENLLLD